jgi:hypothetical protein
MSIVHHFPSMDSTSRYESRVLWSFWIACGLAATGGIAPLLLAAGGTNRIAGAVVPFAVAAIVLGADALMFRQGRPIATALYFVAGIALVYGMLLMISVPVRLAVVGTCSATLTIACAVGLERPLTGGESTGIAFGIAMGTISIFVGFFGLLMLYRIKQPSLQGTPPPTRREAPVVTEHPRPAPVAEPDVVPAAVAAPEPPPEEARKPRVRRTPKPQAELPAPAEPLELAAPEEVLELPAPDPDDEPPRPS